MIRTSERDENSCREPLTPSEMLAIGRAVEALERPAAEERERANQAKPGDGKTGTGNFPVPDKGRVRDKVGDAVGVSGKTYEAVQKVADFLYDGTLLAEHLRRLAAWEDARRDAWQARFDGKTQAELNRLELAVDEAATDVEALK